MITLRNALILLVLSTLTTACAAPGRLMRGYAEADAAEMDLLETGAPFAEAPAHLRGQVRFAFDGFGSLSTDGLRRTAIPWKVLVAALALDRHEHRGAPLSVATAYARMAEYGFVVPGRIANWEGPQPRMERPLGVVSAEVRRGFPSVELEIAAFGCATCHAAPLYGADGHPSGESWLGIPNASLDLTGFGQAATLALESLLERPEDLLDAVRVLYPSVSDTELSVLRKHVLPAVGVEISAEIDHRGYEGAFSHGGPGLMNGIGGLRSNLGLLRPDAFDTEVAWMSPPALAETTMRRSLLVDGTYAPAGSSRLGRRTRQDVAREGLDAFVDMVTLFVFTTFNVDPEHARNERAGVADLVGYFDKLRTPPFPGVVDSTLAAQGATVYTRACAGCHGSYSAGLDDVRLLEHPNRLVAQDRMRTDPERWAAVDPGSLAVLAGLGWEEQIIDRSLGGYIAPDLTGVWATAPYLHNGSVPTLWHLLNAEDRPSRFMVGGHALDYQLMGIRGVVDESGDYVYPEGFEPSSRPMLYDTRSAGRSNAGHEFTGLSIAEKRAVLEYLKVL